MAYKILPYTKKRAKELGVTIKPSTRKNKKIDVFKNGKKIASIGAIGYKDYPTYLKLERAGKIEKGIAKERQRLYKKRHESTRKKRGTPSYYADKLLW